MKHLVAVLVFAALVVACGASFVGPATSDTGDPCQGHLQCPKGCCTWASFDGEGYECVTPPSESKDICIYVGLSDDGTGEFAAKRVRAAGADAAP